MCGRYTLKSGRKKLVEQFAFDDLPEFQPRFNLGPTQDGLVVRTGDRPGTRTAAWLRWGLVPSWTKPGAHSPPLLINARGETVAEKPAFRDAFKRRRCLVLADGFYEWSRLGAVKQPYHLTVNRGEPFAMAGLWERWQPPDAGPDERLETYTIITTAANEVLAPLHDRMPVILDPDFFDDWLNPLVTDPHALQPLLKPYPAVHMFARAVSSRVNNIKHDDAACLAPPAEPGASDATGGARGRATPPATTPNAQLELGFDS
jgi:putative SOS response-associated peptidase YedK